MTDRTERTCDVCGVTDTDPRHELADLTSPAGSFSRHMDCCASEGCPDLSCDQVIAATKARGGDLVKHLTKKGT